MATILLSLKRAILSIKSGNLVSYRCQKKTKVMISILKSRWWNTQKKIPTRKLLRSSGFVCSFTNYYFRLVMLIGTVGWPGTTFAKCCVGTDLINAWGVYSGIYGISMTSLIVTSVTSLSSLICGAVRLQAGQTKWTARYVTGTTNFYKLFCKNTLSKKSTDC